MNLVTGNKSKQIEQKIDNYCQGRCLAKAEVV